MLKLSLSRRAWERHQLNGSNSKPLLLASVSLSFSVGKMELSIMIKSISTTSTPWRSHSHCHANFHVILVNGIFCWPFCWVNVSRRMDQFQASEAVSVGCAWKSQSRQKHYKEILLAKWRFYVKVPYRLLIKKEKNEIFLVNSFGKGSYCSKVLNTDLYWRFSKLYWSIEI